MNKANEQLSNQILELRMSEIETLTSRLLQAAVATLESNCTQP